jgi:hypothetical protein
MRFLRAALVCSGLMASALTAAELMPRTVQAFDDYTRAVETRLDAQAKGPAFLWSDESPERNRQVRQAQILAESLTGGNPASVPGGLIHDWIGAMFIPGATLDKVLRLVEDYDHHKDVYLPEVIGSHVVARNSNDFKVRLRVLKKKVITVVLDTDYDVHYAQAGPASWSVRSYSTRIQEVENAGKPDERHLPAGDDHGYLWRLYSYWRYVERDGGVYMECEAVSLTRDVPTGLGWLIGPIIRDLPRESLVNALRKTREALAQPGR